MGLTGSRLDLDELLDGLGRNVKALTDLGWTMADIAHAAGCSPHVVYDLHDGKANGIRLSTFVRLANIPIERHPRDVIADKAREMIFESDLMNYEIAMMLGVSPARVSDYINLYYRMRPQTSKKIIRVLEDYERRKAESLTDQEGSVGK